MRFMPMGRPIRPSPINPIFLWPVGDSKRALLNPDVREAHQPLAQKEEMIVAELQAGGDRSAGVRGVSSCFGAMVERENAGSAASRRGGSGAVGLGGGGGSGGDVRRPFQGSG